MRRRARLPLLAAGVVLLLLAADTVAWWLATNRMEQEFAIWQRARTTDGGTVLTGPAQRGGWPLQAELLLPDVTLATDTPGRPDALAWQAGQVHLVFAPWAPNALTVQVDGDQTLRFGAALPVTLASGPLDITIPLSASGQAEGAVVDAHALSIPMEGGAVHVDAVSVRLRQEDAFVSATGATLPGRNLPFGGTIQSLDLHARSTGPIPPLRDPAAALAAWRDGGQRLLIDDLALRWGPLEIRGHASLGLDPAMQPEGSAVIQMTGFAEVIDALARAGAITRNDARVATTLLGLMARPGADNASEADLPLTLKDRTLLVGAIPLLRLPVLAVP